MRPGEIAVLLANVVLLCAAAPASPRSIRRGGGMTWLSLTLAVAMAAVLLQVAAEGPRWQMVPAYAPPALAVLVSLPRILRRARRLAPGRIVPRAPHAAALILGALLIGASLALDLLFPVFRLPSRPGPTASARRATTGWTRAASSDSVTIRAATGSSWYRSGIRQHRRRGARGHPTCPIPKR